ncbi:MAG: hypothetical protein AB8B97_07790 [Granulosicoccus sp.]
MNKTAMLYSLLLSTLVLCACSDGSVSGGGAGDTDDEEIQSAIELIQPLIGLYELPENWRGVPTSEAYLEITAPDARGISESLLFIVNDMRNCIEPSRTAGDVTKDPVSDRLFFDSFNIGTSILSLDGTDLVIDLAADVNDIDDDGDEAEPGTLRAARLVNIANASDLGETCQ